MSSVSFIELLVTSCHDPGSMWALTPRTEVLGCAQTSWPQRKGLKWISDFFVWGDLTFDFNAFLEVLAFGSHYFPFDIRASFLTFLSLDMISLSLSSPVLNICVL